MSVTQRKISIIKRYIKAVNKELGIATICPMGKQTQWDRGNFSVMRYNSNLATLSINIKEGHFLVGCDGMKKGINGYLKKNYPLNNKNSQNERYRCTDFELMAVIKHYATVQR